MRQLVNLVVVLAFIGHNLAVPSGKRASKSENGASCDPEILFKLTQGSSEPCCMFPHIDSDFETHVRTCAADNGVPQAVGNAPPPPPGGPKSAPPQRGQRPPFDVECVEECIFSKSGLLTTDKTLDKVKVQQLGSKEFSNDTNWKDVGPKVIKDCSDKAVERVKSSATCKSGSAQFMHCVVRDMFLNCPTKVWKPTEKCIAIKNFIESCPRALPPPQ